MASKNSGVSKNSGISDVLRDLKTCFSQRGVRWYLFGAQAAILYGSARLTADVDVTVALGTTSVPELVALLQRRRFQARVRLDERFIAASRVLPLTHTPSGIPVDVVLAGPGLEEIVLGRVRKVRVGSAIFPVISPEDLIVLKLLAGRPQDLSDVQAVLAGGERIDAASIRTTLAMVEGAIDQSDLSPRFEAIFARIAHARFTSSRPQTGRARKLPRRK